MYIGYCCLLLWPPHSFTVLLALREKEYCVETREMPFICAETGLTISVTITACHHTHVVYIYVLEIFIPSTAQHALLNF